jgi:hypothetical protein
VAGAQSHQSVTWREGGRERRREEREGGEGRRGEGGREGREGERGRERERGGGERESVEKS